MATQAYMVLVHDDGHPTEVILPDGRLGLMFPRASDEGKDVFYGKPEVHRAVFRQMADGKEMYVVAGYTIEEARKELTDPNSDFHQYGAEGWTLVERMAVTFW